MIRGTGAVTTTSARAGWRHSFFKQKTAYEICDKYPAFALMTDRQDRKAFFRELGKYSALGLEMALSVVIGMGIGYYLDRWLGTGPWLMIVWIGLRVAGGGRRRCRAAR